MKLTVKNLRKLIKEEIVNTASPNPWADQRHIVDAIAAEMDNSGNPDVPGYELMDIGFNQGYDLESLEALNDDPDGLTSVANAVVGANDYDFANFELFRAVQDNLDAVLEILREDEGY